MEDEPHLFDLLKESDGGDSVVIYCAAERQIKRLPAGRSVMVEPVLVGRLQNYYGQARVKVVEKPLDKQQVK